MTHETKVPHDKITWGARESLDMTGNMTIGVQTTYSHTFSSTNVYKSVFS